MILDQKPIKVDFSQRGQHFDKITVTITQETFSKNRNRSLDVSKMNVADLLSASKVLDPLQNPIPTAGHLGPGTNTEGEAPGFAVGQLLGALKRLEAAKRPPDAAKRRDRWIVRMVRESNTGLLRDREDSFNEVLPGSPHV